MTQTPPETESLDQKAARWLNIGMVFVLGLLFCVTMAWFTVESWPKTLAALRFERGSKLTDLYPLAWFLVAALNLIVWVWKDGGAWLRSRAAKQP